MTSNPGVEQLQADIERTRAELAHTVDDLTARLDVRTRAKERLQETNPTLVAGGAVIVVLVAAIVIWRRRR